MWFSFWNGEPFWSTDLQVVGFELLYELSMCGIAYGFLAIRVSNRINYRNTVVAYSSLLKCITCMAAESVLRGSSASNRTMDTSQICNDECFEPTQNTERIIMMPTKGLFAKRKPRNHLIIPHFGFIKKQNKTFLRSLEQNLGFA